jgi:hypothetical protein
MASSRAVAIVFLALSLQGVEGADDRSPLSTLLRLTLTEDAKWVQDHFGKPDSVTNGRGFQLLQYACRNQTREHEDGEFEWSFYFDRPSGQLVQVALRPEAKTTVPKAKLKRYEYREGGATLNVEAGPVSDEAWLVAIGMTEEHQTDHFILIRKSALPRFYAWIK